MRNPDRINKILKLIEKIWEENPELRFMQLLGNCLSPGDNYYIEDELLESKLKENYKKRR